MRSLTHTTKSHAASGRRSAAPAAARRPVDSLQRALGNDAVARLAKAGALGPAPQPQFSPEQVAATIVDKTINAPGQPLEPAIRAEMEARFGQDFGNVRIHAGGDAAASAKAINAKAYTVGSNIAFASGQYAPDAAAGRLLLAHELAHVVQQGRGGPEPSLSPSSALEAAAAQAATAATQGEGAIHVGGASGVGVAREEGDSEAAKRRLAAALNPTGKYAHEVTFKTLDEYVASAATNATFNEDGTITAYIYDDRPPVTIAPAVPVKAAPKFTPKPKPKPEPASDIDAGRLREIAEALQPRLIYPKNVTRVFGGLQVIGGGLELAAAAFTAETGVGPLLLGAHAIDTLQTGGRTVWSGEEEKSVLFYAGSGAVFLASDDPKLARAGGLFFDMAGGLGAGAYSFHIMPSPTIALSPEAELDLELAQLARLDQRPRFNVQFDAQWQDISQGVLTPEGYKLNPKLMDLDSLITSNGKIVGKKFGGVYMYVVDESGAIRLGTRVQRSHMPHPTLIGGPEPTVLAAGEIDIRAGQIYSINNLSGHFQPTPNSLGTMYSAFSMLPDSAFKPNFLGFRAYHF
jgi:hypothetical protein